MDGSLAIWKDNWKPATSKKCESMINNWHKYFGKTTITEILNCDPEIIDWVKIVDW